MSYRLPFVPLNTDVFPDCYAAARQRWLALSSGLPFKLSRQAFPCQEAGPNGEPLFTDSVWIGPEDAARVVVLIGGTHGIEGYAGSAIQIDHLLMLTEDYIVLPERTALLIIHALTPWGYAWRRRCDADGVDLNRNFVDFSAPLPANKGYTELREALFLEAAEPRLQRLADFERRHGRIALEMAISAGQYDDPKGPFYGGNKPAHGRQVIEQLFESYALRQRDLAVIDLHTGLGSYGYGEIICDHEPGSTGTQAALRLYGDAVTLPLLGTSSSVPKIGLLDYAWHKIMNERSCYITLEFGSYSTDRLFDVLLRDHQLWAGPASIDLRRQHSFTMLQHFCPADQAWREMVLFRGRQVIAQALEGNEH
ncbi:MAG: M14 family metallopeptidase [Methylococcaceae bacterium]|nr:M14 family metallopeptidase [Methylococcaceae bacterium]